MSKTTDTIEAPATDNAAGTPAAETAATATKKRRTDEELLAGAKFETPTDVKEAQEKMESLIADKKIFDGRVESAKELLKKAEEAQAVFSAKIRECAKVALGL